MKKTFYILAILLLLSACVSSHRKERPPAVQDTEKTLLQVTLELNKSAYDLGERIYCTLRIANKSSQIISIPNISVISGKGGTWPEGVIHCLKFGSLQIGLEREGQSIELLKKWQSALSDEHYLPIIRLMPGAEIKAKFRLAGPWGPKFFSVEREGNYEVKVILDTTRLKDEPVWEGCISSNPVSFTVSQVPVFRKKKAGESDRDYAKARADFYLARILEDKGEYFRNVALILQTSECGWGLISMMDSQDKKKRTSSKQILEAIHSQPWEDEKRKNLPKSMESWSKWWETTGSRMTSRELWHNFDSHWQ